MYARGTQLFTDRDELIAEVVYGQNHLFSKDTAERVAQELAIAYCDKNKVQPIEPLEDDERPEEKFAMTNAELDKAIDTAARHSGISYGHEPCGKLMLNQLQKLLDLQLKRAAIEKLCNHGD